LGINIILTHEQADFDALASLLGASLVDEKSIPVLPRKMNRNVRAFVTLYGMDLPFIEPRDLPPQPVDKVTLVDTQSMVSLKGMSRKTKVRVIDHHSVREDLPENWEVVTDETGATVTLFVEVIRERGGVLSMVQATLLLLGIYEDTGSLTYTRTTSRDLESAAFLLEQGASLGIASSFLNHPLSIKQQELYDRLRASAETHMISGYHIVVACGNAEGMDEELSTIAHKLRDLLDPDALFLVIRTKGGVQLIARSTSDNIDVSELALHFGGGGHSRAAAALIRDQEVGDVRDELVRILPGGVRPALTVSQIMSSGPQVLSPDTPAEEAGVRMSRFGHEGYPIVEEGRVVGLLTRRSVDRALSHGLNLTAASLMLSGEVTIRPEDSIEQLQRLMTETGWGQIPVVNRETGKVIGIVTRTDVLNILNQEARQSRRQNLASRLESALPPARYTMLKLVARSAHEHHSPLYIVGGFVRDLLLDRPSLDFDLVVEGDAISLAKTIARQHGGRVTSHSRFGTAKWYVSEIRELLIEMLKTELEKVEFSEASNDSRRKEHHLDEQDLPETLDFISARTEFYTHPTALPTVERGSIKLDLHRRDFTINTLALRLDGRHYGELHDYWGGLDDLRRGLVRCLHSLSFVDDPTRMLRAVRFEQRFDFEIEERTLELLKEAVSLIERVSGERIRHDLDHILDEERATAMLARLDELNLLTAIHPDLYWNEWLKDRMEALQKMDIESEWARWDPFSTHEEVRFEETLRRTMFFLLWMVQLPAEKARSILSRLKFPKDTLENIAATIELIKLLPSLVDRSPSEIVFQLDEFPPLAIFGAYLAAPDDCNERKILRTYTSEWSNITPTITGHDLVERGLPRGPGYRTILAALRAAWLDGDVSTPEEEAALLEKLIGSENGQEDYPSSL
jgi:tRNA nucleotidyltransferase (CCA-adding enzyme)